MERLCIVCNLPFLITSSRSRKVRCGAKECARSANSARKQAKRETEVKEVQFIGVDGEGINTFKFIEEWDEEAYNYVTKRVSDHQYVLLSVGDRSLHNNGKELGYWEIFPFLWECYLENPDAAFVGYFLGYDFTMWLRRLDGFDAWKLLHTKGIATRFPKFKEAGAEPFPVVIDGKWEIDILGDKRFKIRPHIRRDKVPTEIVNHKDGTASVKPIKRPWMYICDTGAFFQTSFLNAIDPKGWQHPIVTDAEFAIIKEGKENRSDAAFDPAMIRYNILENEILGRLMGIMNDGFQKDGIKLTKKQWFGPGQAAQTWLKNIGAPTGEEIRAATPFAVREAARSSYFGGWFEILAHGIVKGTSYAYDINSAYPEIISKLPCFLHGSWVPGTGKIPPRKGAYRLVRATVAGADKYVGPMPHRQRNGNILRPRFTDGWFWNHELEASAAAGLISEIRITECWDYIPCKCPPPLASIRELYQGRLDVGKNSAWGKAKKLIYNSAYGKFAQSIGNPKFGNALYASLITAGCRTMILQAIASHPSGTSALLMVATDSVTFSSPHPNLEINGEKLGAWDYTEHENLTLFLPGMYWDNNTRQKIEEGKAPKLKSRGVPSNDLAAFVPEIDRQFKAGEAMPKVDVPIRFSITTAKLAAARDDWSTCGQVNHFMTKTLQSENENKRRFGGRDRKLGNVIRSFPWDMDKDDNIVSYPYNKMFGDDSETDENLSFKEITTPDGPAGYAITDGLGLR